jgi:signal transduction histidine kinase
LKTPLVTIRGFLGFLEESVAKNNPTRIKSDIERIANATDKMHSMINELLELSRIGRIMNPPEDVSFEDIVHEGLRMVEGLILASHVKLEIDTNLPMIQGDRPRLVEVIQNLVDNAIKYMGSQSEPAIHIGGRIENDLQILFVQDNGMGIDPLYHEKIFGLFDKLDPLSDGTGIGLTLVKLIVTVHGGRVWVESEGLGKGSTFCFTLPIKE